MSTSNETSGQAYKFGPQVSPEFKGLFKVFAAAAGTAVADQLTALDSETNANASKSNSFIHSLFLSVIYRQYLSKNSFLLPCFPQFHEL